MTTVNAENIRARYRERAKWLLWDDSSDTPRRPHWRGDFSISWSDPNDWHTFDEAMEAAQERDSWGVIYVITTDDDEYMIDVDGGYTDDGEPREWFPGPDRFTDAGAYIEWSPSGDGLHIPVEGEPPDWWKDCEVDPDVHQGVDVLTNHPCTFTGDKHPESGDEVTDINAAPFLFNVYQNIRGESPRLDSDEPDREQDYDDEWLNDDDIRDALDTITPDVPHREWIKLGYAVHDHDSGSGGKALFESWSQGGEKWDEQAQRSIDSIWSNATQGSDVTVGTLVHKAKQNGWEVPTPDGGATVAATGGGASTGPGGGGDGIPKPPGPAPLVEKNGGYYKRTFHDGEPNDQLITNFQLEVLSRLSHPDGTKQYRLKVHPDRGEPYEVTVEPVVFNEVRKFKREVPTGWSTIFDGGQKELNLLKEFVGDQDVRKRTATRMMGLHGDELVTPNGVLTTEGWSENPETAHLSRGVGLEQKWTLTPEDDANPDHNTVGEIAELLPKTRPYERLLPVLGWFCAATLRPAIMERTGQFNFLTVLGETGSGKTSTLSMLWEAFGMDGEPFTPSDTKFALTVTLAGTNSVPVWFDEWKPSDMREYDVDQFLSLLRKTTRGGIEQRGNRDKTTDEYPLHAPVVVSGEERIHGSAEGRRAVFVTFKGGTTNPGTDAARAFKKVVGGSFTHGDGMSEYTEGCDLSEFALAWYQFILGLSEKRTTELWREQRKRVETILHKQGHQQPGDLVRQGLQTIAFGCELYRTFAESYDAQTFDAPAIDDAIAHVADHSLGGMNRKSHWDTFLEVATRVTANGDLEEGEHYTVVNDGEPTAELRLHLGTTVDIVKRYAHKHEVAEDLLGSVDDYRERAKQMAEGDASYITHHHQGTHLNNRQVRCVSINIPTANGQNEEFEPSAWGAAEPNGPPDDARGSLADSQRVVKLLRTEGAVEGSETSLPAGAVAGKLGWEPQRASNAIERGREQGTILKGPNGYRATE